jgi:sulfate adenylyltransferase
MSSSDISARDGAQDPHAGRGVCIWLTGPSGAGKSTVTNELLPLLAESGRTVSVLDVVPVLRKMPCERTSEGKLLRKAFVAGEVARHGGIAICVTVSARRRTREEARRMIGSDRFIEVLIDAPDEVTAARKSARPRKPSLAKRAKRALGPIVARIAFRGHDTYEMPVAPDLRIDTTLRTPMDGARAIFDLLVERGFVVGLGTERMEGASEVASGL